MLRHSMKPDQRGRMVWIVEQEDGRRYYSYDNWVTFGETPERALWEHRIRFLQHAVIVGLVSFIATVLTMWALTM